MAKLILKDGESERAFELRDPVTTFGRAPENGIVLEEKECSRKHFQIERTDQGYKLVDLESRNGTKVNDRVVNQQLLSHGDRIQIGATVLVFQSGATIPPPPTNGAAPTVEASRRDATTTIEKLRGLQRPPGTVTGSGSGLVKWIVLGAAFLGGLVIVLIVAGRITREDPEVRAARDLVSRAEFLRATDPKRAEEMLRQVPQGGQAYYARAQELLREMEREAVRLENPEDPEETAFFEDIRDLERTLDLSYVRTADRCREYETRYPNGRSLAEVRRIRGLAEARASSVETSGVAATHRKVTELAEKREYAQALRCLEEARRDRRSVKFDLELAQRKTKVFEEADQYYRAQIDQGHQWTQQGKKEEARARFQDLKSALSGVPEFELLLRTVERHLQSLGGP